MFQHIYKVIIRYRHKNTSCGPCTKTNMFEYL